MEFYKLHKEEDKSWREWIRASGKNLMQLFRKTVNTIKEKEGKNFKEIAKELKISYKMFQDWTKGRRAIPLWALKEIENKTGINFEEEINLFKIYGSQKVKKPLISNELVEIIGRHCGDGSCTYNKRTKTYRTNIRENFSLLKQHQKDLNKVLGIKCQIQKEKENYLINVYSKIYFRIITEIFQIPAGSTKTYTVKEPEIIKKLPINQRKYWLRGVIDTDGWIYHNKENKSYILGLIVASKDLADSVHEILNLLAIPARKKTKRKYFQVEVTKKEDIKKYLEIVGSKNNRILNKSSLLSG